MNVPKPPKKQLTDPIKTKPKRRSNRSNKKLITYIYTLPNGFKGEVRASDLAEVGAKCYTKHRAYPVDVVKKPFERPQNLTQKLSSHEGLRALHSTLTNPKKGNRRG